MNTLSDSADAVRTADLRRMKRVATGLLVAVTVLFVVMRIVGDDDGVAGYVSAFAEAAMVGALADWFAVTALFRHPLGLPIPHTAIIARRKNEIGKSLGEFVQGNFLTGEVIEERLGGLRVGARAGEWLADDDNARRATAAIADGVRGAIEVLDDSDVQRGLEQIVVRRIQAQPVGPILARVVDGALASGYQQRAFDTIMVGLSKFLDENRTTFRQRLASESPWWVPEQIDDRVFDKIFNGLQRFLADVHDDPGHEVRHALDERLVRFAERLKRDPAMHDKLERLKHELLEHPEVQAWLGSLWQELRASLLAAADDPASDLQRQIQGGLTALGRRLADDESLQRKIDDWVRRVVAHVVENYRGEVAELISTTVERWDAEDTSRRIEIQVGRDLQFIRINGTVVGGLAGLVIHAIGTLL